MAAQSKGGRSSFVNIPLSPGPAYSPGYGIEIGGGRGFSFGTKEKTIDERSTITVRCVALILAAVR